MKYHVTKTFQKLHFTFCLKYHVQYTQCEHKGSQGRNRYGSDEITKFVPMCTKLKNMTWPTYQQLPQLRESVWSII